MGRKILAALAALFVSSSAHAAWQQATSQHFVVYSDDSPDNVKAYATQLEKYDKAMRMLRLVADDRRGPASRISIFVVGDIDAVRKIYGDTNSSVAGFMQSRATGSVGFIPKRSDSSLSARTIMLHEYAHHFMFADWPTAVFPKWFVEGFAEFHATAIFGADGSVTFGANPDYRKYTVGETNLLPLSRLLRPDVGKLDKYQTDALYSRGWLLTHYLTFDPDRRKQLSDYIGAINAGKSTEEATTIFGNVDQLDIKLTNYAASPKLRSALFPSAQLAIGEVTVRQLTPGEAATMPARISSTRGVNKITAPKVAALARDLAAAYPNDASAQNVLAEAEYDAENYAAAEAAADRALAADPKSVHAMIYKGMAKQAVAEKAKSTDPETWKLIRRQYLAANRVDTEDPQPLIMYYKSFEAAKQPPPKSADDGLLYAYALAPFDLALRIDAAKVHMRQGNAKDARIAILPVAYSVHAGKMSEQLRGVVSLLEEDDAKGALAELTRIEDEEKAKADKAKDAQKS